MHPLNEVPLLFVIGCDLPRYYCILSDLLGIELQYSLRARGPTCRDLCVSTSVQRYTFCVEFPFGIIVSEPKKINRSTCLMPCR